ncbi:Imm5 family immunity protein [Bacteroides finegoldii]|uniref:Imm5 family immunity protein n=1 Tax=Bacteroides finegoldii TaxID=338188 RepID=UPI0026DD19EE|nr:Imm5 family immunity protein [Bacteroides finegoldii]
MDKVREQHGSIVLYEEKKDGEQYIRIAYADNPAIAPMLSQELGISLDGNGNAYIKASDFRLSIFHDRYSPHTYIDYSRLYVGYPKSKREYIFPKLYSDKDTITDRIERLKELINQSSMGHLPLPLRIDLMKRISDIRVVQKIQCECCKKIYFFAGKKNNVHAQVLSCINSYLYKAENSVEDILLETEKLRIHIEDNYKETDTAVGWAIVMLGYTVCYDAASILNIEDYCGEDDGSFDHESWNADFIGSIVYSGGNPFVNEGNGDTGKRKEYWHWYLDMILSIYKNSEREIITFVLPEKATEIPDFPEELIKEGLEEISSSPQGHLSRPLRYKILQAFRSPRIAGRVGILCALKVLPIWRKYFGENHEIIELLRKAEYCLGEKATPDEIKKIADYISSLVEGHDYGTNFAPLMAGMAAVQAAYTVTDGNDCEEVAENDEELASDEWDAAFLASLSCNGGAADLSEINPESNREFWKWYLTDCIPYVYENEKYSGCHASNKIRIPTPTNCNVTLSDKINRLNSALDSYIHAPTNRKEILRMQPYATDGELIRIVADFLQGYPCIPFTAQELEIYCMVGLFDYDIIRFWYCAALLALSPDSCAIAYLSKLAHTLMEQGPGDLHILYRIVLLLPEQKHLHELNRELTDYYERIIPTLVSAKWLAKVNIPYPDDFEWSISFHFTSDGEMFPVSDNKRDEQAWFVLTVRLFGPRSLFYDYARFTSYQIHVCNGDNSIHGDWNEKDGFLVCNGEWLMKDEPYTPDQLVLLMHKLSNNGIRFSKIPASIYTTKGISRKAVVEWIKSEMKLYENDRMEEVRNKALGLHKYDGDVEDTLAEMRKRWGKDVPILKDKRFDEIITQYFCLSHEAGIAALGQELTACGYVLYDLDGDEIYLLELLPQTEMQAFEKKCSKYGQYCQLLKQPHRDFGITARHINLRKQMPREKMEWPDDGICYIVRGFAGYFADGEWKPKDEEQWLGTFIVDLRIVPLQPVKFKTRKIHSFRYSKELDFYAALYSTSLGEMPIGGKNPLEAEKWSRLCDLSADEKYDFRWCGHYLCLGDAKSVIIHTMTEQGVKYVSRIILPDGLMYPPGFGIDGKGTLYITMGDYCRSGIIRYDDNGKYTTLPFSMFGYETFREGCIPVPDTARIILLHEYNARNNSGIWLEPGLLDLDMATRRCRIAPLHHIGDGLFGLHIFQEDWILVEGNSDNGNRSDYARLWNRRTDEVLRIRPGVFGSEAFKKIHALPDGTIVVNTHQHTDDILSLSENFWHFLRTASRPNKLGYWLNYPKPYPDIDLLLPPISEDITLMSTPPCGKLPIAKPRLSEKDGKEQGGSPELSEADGVEIAEGRLRINGKYVGLPLSYTIMTDIFGKEKVVFTYQTMQDDNGKTIQYDRRSFLVWEDAGVTAARNEENVYNISVIYLWITENKVSIPILPIPAGLFGGEIIVDGTKWDKTSDMTARSGTMEIATSLSDGYMEITFANTRNRKFFWQNWRKIMVENLQVALVKRDCIRQLERNGHICRFIASDNTRLLAEMSESFLDHAIQALYAGYSMRRSERYLKANLLPCLVEAAIKCIEYSTVRTSDILFVYSGCVLLGYEKMNMKRLGETMAKKGVRDFVFDTLIRCRIPDWEVTEYTVFPEIKKWILSQVKSGSITEAKAALKNISCISENILITDALITSTLKI